MMRRETGVGQFVSPLEHIAMIAGYAVVPETGWGVMVAQPVSELHARSNTVNRVAAVIALLAFAGAAVMSWLLALYLARPVRQVAAAAEAVLSGNDEVAVPAVPRPGAARNPPPRGGVQHHAGGPAPARRRNPAGAASGRKARTRRKPCSWPT